ncbi:MAG: Host attachment protein [Proteobacteria bacterium]|nr:Host attachment protein [Pseudomonadota bacterium]
MDIPRNAHVLVIDGGKMFLFKNQGDPVHPDLTIVAQDDQDSSATSDQGTDQPGTSFQSAGGRRSSYEQTDFHQQDEDRFAIDAANMLKREAQAGRIEALILVAAPRTLGVLRKHLHGEVEKRVIGEISKDIAGRSVKEILAAIAVK